jgi:hypothetical protein
MLSHGDASALKLSSSKPTETRGCSEQYKCTQSKRKRYRNRWSSRTTEPALRGGQISETRAAGCVAPRELARGKPSHPLHRRIQTPSPGGSGRMLCSLATSGLRKKHECTVVRRRHRGQRLTVTVQSHCQECLSSSRKPAAIAQTVEPSAGRSAENPFLIHHLKVILLQCDI